MKNPLWKRIPKELKEEFGKYLVIFLFLAITTGIVSGFIVSGESMIKTYDNSFEKYNVEHGHFTLKAELTDDMKDYIESEEDVGLYEQSYFEKTASTEGAETRSTLRIFAPRQEVNTVCLMDGELPSGASDIAIDRVYANNNSIEIGDELTVDGKTYSVSGFVALPDYSTMFQNVSDTMFDATIFGVAMVTNETFDSFGDKNKYYSYAWKYDDGLPTDEKDEKELSDDLLETVYMTAMTNGMEIENYVPRYQNQAINFAGEDTKSDTGAMKWFEYIMIVIMAYLFAVTTSNTIEKEAATIGTLRASGYTRGELLTHYIMLPVIVTLLSSVIGNILGYTVFKEYGANLYYNSYSYTKYTTYWNADAFVLTTVIPIILMFVINLCVINNKLRLSPLRFIRRDLKKTKTGKALRLPHWKFFTRFKTRVILQNIPGYVIMLIGVLFAQVLLLYGFLFPSMLDDFEKDTLAHVIAEHQYILDQPVDTDSEDAETYCVTTLKTTGDIEDEITVYGIHESSRYFDAKLNDGDVLVSDGYEDKYRPVSGDVITLSDSYGDTTYDFKMTGSVEYPSTLSIFVTEHDFREIFDKDEDYFTGYFSDAELDDIEEHVVTDITKDDLTKLSRQLTNSMGSMMDVVAVFALILFMLLIYLLTKLIIEKNTVSISMVKILGYDTGEIRKLYISPTTLMVAVVTIVDIAVSLVLIKVIFRAMMLEMLSGWFILKIPAWIAPVTFALSFVCYLVVSVFQMSHIRKIPMDEALKNVE